MCGIAGAFGSSLATCAPDITQVLLSRMAHRGPDGQGVFLLTEAGPRWGTDLALVPRTRALLLHRRLSIIDCTDGGWQPMKSQDGRLSMVFNGEIYNYIELRSELEKLGHNFRSQSDSEVLLTAYAEWGANALPKLVGMFAFAIIDVAKRELFLARDHFGIKPLYYHAATDLFCFASELKAMLDWPDLSRDVDPQAVYLYLRYGLTDQAGRTLLSSVTQLPAAHYLVVSLDRPEAPDIHRYWDIERTRNDDITFAEAATTLRELFLKSVELHLRSDVPVGAALSGGVDSSSIVMAMRRLLGHQMDLHTFSYTAAGSPQNEERWVDIVASAAGAIAHKTTLSVEDLQADVDALVYQQDEPFVSTSVFAQRSIFNLARRTGIKVMLEGQGADELIGGYDYLVAARVGSLVRSGRLREAMRLLSAVGDRPDVTSRQMLTHSMAFLLPMTVQEPLRRLVGRSIFPSWLDPQWFANRSVHPVVFATHRGDEVLNSHLRRALTQTSLPHLLRYGDRNSMAFSIESRVPFLTPSLASFVFSLPEEFIVSGTGTSKAVFRQAMRDIVPDSILDRRDKIGFATPEVQWLSPANSWINQHLSAASDLGIPIHAQDLRRPPRRGGARTDQLWRCANLVAWSQRFGVSYG